MDTISPKSWNKKSKPHLFCAGCGHAITLKQLGFVIDEMGIQSNTTLGIDIGCSLLAWNFFDLDTIQTHHGRTAPTMVGYKLANEKRIALAYVGDGAAYAIGLQSLIHTALRNNPITVIIINNENYAMTGGQMAPTTEEGVVTTTSPNGKSLNWGNGFKGPELIRKVAAKSAYITRVSVSKPLLIRQAFKKAIENQIKNNSFSLVEVLSICPTNWKTNAKQSFIRLSDTEEFYRTGEIVNNSKISNE